METSDVITDIPDAVFNNVTSETVWNRSSGGKSPCPSKRKGMCRYRFRYITSNAKRS